MSDTFYSREQVSTFQQHLEAAAKAPRTRFTKQQAIEAIAESVIEALKTRTYQEIADMLAEGGLEVTAGSLKQYVSRYKRENQSAKTMRKRPAVKKAPTPAPAPVAQKRKRAAAKKIGKATAKK